MMTVWTKVLVAVVILSSLLVGAAGMKDDGDSLTLKTLCDTKGDAGPIISNDPTSVDETSPLIRRKREKGDEKELEPISTWVVPAINAPDGEGNLTINEAVPGNTPIIIQSQPPAISYSLVNQSKSGMFSLYDSGLLRIETGIDYEQGVRTFTITVEGEAEDSSTSTVTVTLWIADVNDEPPIFADSLYKVVIPDSTESGTTLASLTVGDIDHSAQFRDVSLTISDGDTDNLFTVFDDGTLKVGFRKNLRNKTAYYLTVRAYDGVNEGFTHVVVGICSSQVLEFVLKSDVISIHTVSTDTLSAMTFIYLIDKMLLF